MARLIRRFSHLNLVSIRLGRPISNHAYNLSRASALPKRYCHAMDSTYTYAHGPDGYSRRVAVTDRSSRLEWDTGRIAKENACAIALYRDLVKPCRWQSWGIHATAA